MLFGIVIGTYSSIFIAAPLLGYLGVKRDTVGSAPKPKEAAPVIAPASAAGADRAKAAAAAQAGGSRPRRPPRRGAERRGARMPSAKAHFPGRAPIDAYGNGGFRFADMSHRGSLLIVPSGIYGWDVAALDELTPERCAGVPRRAGAPRLRAARHRARSTACRPQPVAQAVRRGRHRPRADEHRRRRAHV